VAAGVGGVVALVTAYRRQRIGEFAERREGPGSSMSGSRPRPGSWGMPAPRSGWPGCLRWPADLADVRPQQRQTCVDVLCAYLRMPYDPEPAGQSERHAFLAERQVRHTVICVITAHLKLGTAAVWTSTSPVPPWTAATLPALSSAAAGSVSSALSSAAARSASAPPSSPAARSSTSAGLSSPVAAMGSPPSRPPNW
jgi:hypothetical protein